MNLFLSWANCADWWNKFWISIQLKCGFLRKSFIMNAPLISYHFWVGLLLWIWNSVISNDGCKVKKKIWEDSLDSIPSPSLSVKIQIMGGKNIKAKHCWLLLFVNKLFVLKTLLITPSNVLPLHLKQTFPPIIWIFTKGEGGGIQSRLPF